MPEIMAWAWFARDLGNHLRAFDPTRSAFGSEVCVAVDPLVLPMFPQSAGQLGRWR